MKISSKIFVVLLCLVIINVLLYLFLTSNKPIIIPPKVITIPDSDLKGNEYEFNMYYTAWCGWSQKALPDFVKLKDWVHGIKKNSIGDNKVYIHMIDVDKVHKIDDYKTKQQIQNDIKLIGVKSYPTIVLFNGKTRLIEQYDGDRTLKGYKKLLNNLSNK
jgi:thiol-disulfide isomerase/thioredoxin